MKPPSVPPSAPSPPADSALPRRPSQRATGVALVAAGIALVGTLLRLLTWAKFQGVGFDESLYARYLSQLQTVGLWNYPDIVDAWATYQRTIPGSILPPTRFLYIFAAWVWHGLFGTAPLASFHAVSRAFSVGNLLLGMTFAFRLGGPRLMLGAGALLAFSPLGIHMAQHALVDGFFTFWAMLTLWAFWEALRAPGRRRWLWLYGAGLALMVLTKENAFFVFMALLVLLGANRWLRFGTVTRPLLAVTLAGPLVGVAVLTNLAGGFLALIGVYRLGVEKNMHLEYAILTGDGPWHRYLLDLLTMSPLVLLLAVGMALRLRRRETAGWFLLVFVVASYALMCNVKYGMNLRYATIWDLPLRCLAFWQLTLMVGRWTGPRWRTVVLTTAVAGLCAVDLAQYYRLAVQYPLYELVPADLLRALNILK